MKNIISMIKGQKSNINTSLFNKIEKIINNISREETGFPPWLIHGKWKDEWSLPGIIAPNNDGHTPHWGIKTQSVTRIKAWNNEWYDTVIKHEQILNPACEVINNVNYEKIKRNRKTVTPKVIKKLKNKRKFKTSYKKLSF